MYACICSKPLVTQLVPWRVGLHAMGSNVMAGEDCALCLAPKQQQHDDIGRRVEMARLKADSIPVVLVQYSVIFQPLERIWIVWPVLRYCTKLDVQACCPPLQAGWVEK